LTFLLLNIEFSLLLLNTIVLVLFINNWTLIFVLPALFPASANLSIQPVS